jgi:hypothetical protein
MALGLPFDVADSGEDEVSERVGELGGRSLALVDALDRRCGRDDEEAA